MVDFLMNLVIRLRQTIRRGSFPYSIRNSTRRRQWYRILTSSNPHKPSGGGEKPTRFGDNGAAIHLSEFLDVSFFSNGSHPNHSAISGRMICAIAKMA